MLMRETVLFRFSGLQNLQERCSVRSDPRRTSRWFLRSSPRSYPKRPFHSS